MTETGFRVRLTRPLENLAYYGTLALAALAVLLFTQGRLTLNFVNAALFVVMLTGMLVCYADLASQRRWGELALALVFPLWLLRFVLRLEEGPYRRALAILVHGAFVLFCFIGILRIIMAPYA